MNCLKFENNFLLPGKSTGFVTTTRVNHATPAGLYAHTPSRSWYGDRDLTVDAKRNGCKDIAQQFYDNSHMFTVRENVKK